MEKVEITKEMIKIQYRNMPNWKAPGKDGVQGHWLRNHASFHPCLAL